MPSHRVAGAASASDVARVRSPARSSEAGSRRDIQVRAAYAAACWPCTTASPATTGTSVATSSPGVGVRHPTRPTTSTVTATAAATSSQASWRRTHPVAPRHRAHRATSQSSWKTVYAGWASADHTVATTAGAGPEKGWATSRSAEAYSTGHSRDSSEQTAATATTAMTTGRHRGDGSRPSGKQMTAIVTSAMPVAMGHTPSHAAHRSPPS